MLTQNLPTSLGSDSQKIGPLRNASWKRGQPGELTTIQPSTPKKTTVETSAIEQRASAFARRPRTGALESGAAVPTRSTGRGPRRDP